jgi:hypothetical protein
MRYILIFFIAVGCQGPQPQYQFESETIDLGAKSMDEVVEAHFKLYNTGATELEIERILTDCHCTVPDFPGDPILPADSAIITLVYDKSKEGFFEQTGSVYFKSLKYPHLLIIRGELSNSSNSTFNKVNSISEMAESNK